MSFAEMEAWLRALPDWEEQLSMWGSGLGEFKPRIGGSGQGGKSSKVEAEVVRRSALAGRVDLLRAVVQRLPEELRAFVQFHYLARTATGGHTFNQTRATFKLTMSDYNHWRERALLPFIASLYWTRTEPGARYSYCEQYGTPLPKELRSTDPYRLPGEPRSKGNAAHAKEGDDSGSS